MTIPCIRILIITVLQNNYLILHPHPYTIERECAVLCMGFTSVKTSAIFQWIDLFYRFLQLW